MVGKKVYFAKVKPDATIPSKRDEDVGYDLYACFDEDYIIIEPFTSKLIPTGIASAFSKEYGLIFYERGSTGVKNLKVNAGVIDSGFRNEIFVCLYNANEKPVMITKSDNKDAFYYLYGEDYIIYPCTKAIAQAIIINVPRVEVNEISYDELKNIKSDRGMGMVGSSNK